MAMVFAYIDEDGEIRIRIETRKKSYICKVENADELLYELDVALKDTDQSYLSWLDSIAERGRSVNEAEYADNDLPF